MLWRHLRTLNMAKIPSWAAIGKPQPDEVHPAEVFEAVVFRHWDPRVLGAILPVLDAAQFAKLLGLAEEIAFVAVDFGRARRVVKAPDWPPAPTGLLTIRSEQMPP